MQSIMPLQSWIQYVGVHSHSIKMCKQCGRTASSVIQMLHSSIFTMNSSETERTRRPVGHVSKACGKHFANSIGFRQRRRSGYNIGTVCHVLDHGSTKKMHVATKRARMSTASLEQMNFSNPKRGEEQETDT